MILTSRLQLLSCTLQYFEALLQGEEVLSELLHIRIPEPWTEYPEIILVAYDKLRNDPSMLGWFFYLVIHKEDKCLIGAGGFKGRPDKDGTVEIGYEISAPYREQGYGTELTQALVRFAFSHSYVNKVVAHTEEEYNAAVKVLQKSGMHFVGEDPEQLWKWEITRDQYQWPQD
ncbi:GNAT family N-acetyltransferase [Chitinophaga pinensis]|uniref:GCN5-related N-acetyltransferase n=1 Tax=Chitinophaga pinensis (strain ATCC 43595 / DSM 2588 / LMG 13176 / NBRC 15968 / NCIMB 11800 / UQM 2034) TaxID=485918 RepID=A0A979G007_CHIPD|nr:GNAT family N-acetyltransferase [Chitinophaga pinensis]ACU58211.1 GCN5-related N-acetyltransferase [Chitinophaga pinensis DSM 2588]